MSGFPGRPVRRLGGRVPVHPPVPVQTPSEGSLVLAEVKALATSGFLAGQAVGDVVDQVLLGDRLHR